MVLTNRTRSLSTGLATKATMAAPCNRSFSLSRYLCFPFFSFVCDSCKWKCVSRSLRRHRSFTARRSLYCEFPTSILGFMVHLSSSPSPLNCHRSPLAFYMSPSSLRRCLSPFYIMFLLCCCHVFWTLPFVRPLSMWFWCVVPCIFVPVDPRCSHTITQSMQRSCGKQCRAPSSHATHQSFVLKLGKHTITCSIQNATPGN